MQQETGMTPLDDTLVILRSITPEELLGIQRTTLEKTTRRGYTAIASIADSHLQRPNPDRIKLHFQEVYDASTAGIGQLYMLDSITERYLQQGISVPVLRYGPNIDALYVLQDEPKVVNLAIFKALSLHEFATIMTNTLEQTLIQEFTAAHANAQFLLKRDSEEIVEDCRKIITLSTLSITQLRSLIAHSKQALQGEAIPLRDYHNKMIIDVPFE